MAKRSKKNRLNWQDILKGVVVAILTSVLAGAEQLFSNGGDIFHLDHKQIATWAATAGVGYLLKNLGENSDGELLKREPEKPGSDNAHTFSRN